MRKITQLQGKINKKKLFIRIIILKLPNFSAHNFDFPQLFTTEMLNK